VADCGKPLDEIVGFLVPSQTDVQRGNDASETQVIWAVHLNHVIEMVQTCLNSIDAGSGGAHVEKQIVHHAATHIHVGPDLNDPPELARAILVKYVLGKGYVSRPGTQIPVLHFVKGSGFFDGDTCCLVTWSIGSLVINAAVVDDLTAGTAKEAVFSVTDFACARRQAAALG
jgi:hypothetical protein